MDLKQKGNFKSYLFALCVILAVSATTVVAKANQRLSDVGRNGFRAITDDNVATDASQDMTENVTVVDETQSFAFGADMQIRDALDILAAKYKKNIVSSPKIVSKLACNKLYDVTFEEAVEAIIGTDFKYKQQGNLIKVYTAAEYNNIKKEKSLMTYKVFTLYYITAADAREMVLSILSEDGEIKATAAASAGVPTVESIGPQTGGGNTNAMEDTLIICDYPDHLRLP